MGKFLFGALVGAALSAHYGVRVRVLHRPAPVEGETPEMDVDTFDEMWDSAQALRESNGFIDKLLSDLADLGSSLTEEDEKDG